MGCCQRLGYLVPLFFGCLFFFGSIGFDFLISMGINEELSKVCLIPWRVRVSIWMHPLNLSLFSLTTYTIRGTAHLLQQRLVLTNDTEFYQNWVAPRLPMYSKFHMFHVRNAEQFLKGKEPADLEQVGPFTFGKKLQRKIYAFTHNDTEITFRTTTFFKYLPEMSNDTAFDQNITILNLPMAVCFVRGCHAE